MAVNHGKAEIEEVTSVLTPAPGVSLETALADAALLGYESLEIDAENDRVVVTWFKKRGE